MVELDGDVVINYTNEDFARLQARYEAQYKNLLEATETTETNEKKKKIAYILKRFNEAIQAHVPLSDLHMMDVQTPIFEVTDTFLPEGVLVWAVTVGPWDVRYFTKEGFLRKKKELEAKIDKAKNNLNFDEKKLLEAELRKYLKAP